MNKKRIIFITIAFVLCIIMAIILNYTQKYMQELKMQESIDGRTAENQLLLNGVGAISEKYTGNFKTAEIIDKLNEVTKEDLPNLYKDIKKYDDAKLEKYYEENSTSIKKKFGKKDSKEFISFAKELQNSSNNLKKWYRLDIDRQSISNDTDKKGFVYFEYTVTYENDETMKFSMYVSNNKSVGVPFIVDIK